MRDLMTRLEKLAAEADAAGEGSAATGGQAGAGQDRA
jgi:hypothetical protein